MNEESSIQLNIEAVNRRLKKARDLLIEAEVEKRYKPTWDFDTEMKKLRRLKHRYFKEGKEEKIQDVETAIINLPDVSNEIDEVRKSGVKKEMDAWNLLQFEITNLDNFIKYQKDTAQQNQVTVGKN